jgi:hypothetical protein
MIDPEEYPDALEAAILIASKRFDINVETAVDAYGNKEHPQHDVFVKEVTRILQ